MRWHVASSYPKTLDTLIRAVDTVVKRVAELTGNKFQVKVLGLCEILPVLRVLDALKNATVECCQAVSYFCIGKNPEFGFGTALAFGLNTRQ